MAQLPAVIIDALGAFDQATLICTGLPWGDFWNEDDRRWKSLYEWRRALGAATRLHDTAGHEVDVHQVELLRQAIAWALYLGWDGELFASMWPPHDGRLIPIHADAQLHLRGD
jgi:hypothetical protein